MNYPPGEIIGFLSGCPVCAARRRGPLPKGTRFQIISGHHSGKTGIVTEEAERHKIRPYKFLAQMDGEPETQQQRILYEIEFVEPLPLSPRPDWCSGLHLRDLAAFHNEVLRLCDASASGGPWQTDFRSLAVLTIKIWQQRISISPDELWAVLSAHGVPNSVERDMEQMYDFGIRCLILACGRKPIKKEE